MGQPLVHVVIVHWNSWNDTLACVASVLNTNYTDLRVLVVDNHSTAGSDTELRKQWPEVQVLRSPVNAGFASGANLGIAQAMADEANYVLMLNNDAIVDRASVPALVAVAEQNSDVGIVGPTIYYLDPPDRIWFAGANRNRWTLSLGHRKGKWNRLPFDQPRDVNYLCAGAMLVRREVFEQVGLFDAGYFMYYEDCDFCMRVSEQGYRLCHVPEAKVWHKVAASTGGEGSPLEVYYRTWSVFRFLAQHAHGIHRTGLIVLRVGYVLLRATCLWLCGQQKVARFAWLGLRDGLASMSDGAVQRQ
jgi:GT2 family glycosyltransferase